jgi:Ca-activated chloride channel family protein
MIHIDWPWVFALLPLPLLVTFSRVRATGNSIRIPANLAYALTDVTNNSTHKISMQAVLLWLSWFTLLVALSQPWHPGKTVVQPVSGRAIAVAVDVSGSMERRDFELNGEFKDRLSIVKDVAQTFITNRQGDRISLVLYGKEAFIASPLTFDLASVNSILASSGIGMAGRSTAIGDAIGLAIQTLSKDPSSLKAIVLLSDGTNNAGSVEPESAATLAKTLGIRIHTIALGSEDTKTSGYKLAQSADLDEQTLRAVAENSQGTFYRAKTYDDLQDIYTTIDALERTEVNAPPVILRHDLRHWPLYLMLISLLLHTYVQRTRA